MLRAATPLLAPFSVLAKVVFVATVTAALAGLGFSTTFGFCAFFNDLSRMRFVLALTGVVLGLGVSGGLEAEFSTLVSILLSVSTTLSFLVLRRTLSAVSALSRSSFSCSESDFSCSE